MRATNTAIAYTYTRACVIGLIVKGDMYWKYDVTAGQVEDGYPKKYGSTKLFPGVPAGLDAAVAHPSNGKNVYFFKGDEYWRYDMTKGAVDKGYPHTYGNSTWPGVPANVDAAMSHWSDHTSIFFFKGSEHWKYNYAKTALYPGYPKPFGTGTGYFEGVPSGLAAGFNRCGPEGPPQFGAGCEFMLPSKY